MLIRSLGTGSLRTKTLGSLWAGSGYLPVLYALFAASGIQLVKAIDWVLAHNVRIEMSELSQAGNSSSEKEGKKRERKKGDSRHSICTRHLQASVSMIHIRCSSRK